ncbi:hypothetical protein GF325_01895 [Candidatus Bathyarchaeota archaeon]|nr:hypothetical protein [Candidatus Bathyarchaeota archaeon]
MLKPLIDLFPILLLFIGAMGCLSLDFRKPRTKYFLLALLCCIILLIIIMGIWGAPPDNGNYLTDTSNYLMIVVCLVQAVLISVNSNDDFEDMNIERFHHVSSLLIIAGLIGFLFMDNLFLAGSFLLMALVLLSLLNFIYPTNNKRALNLLISTFGIGFVMYMLGCLSLLELGLPVTFSGISSSPLDVPLFIQWFFFIGLLFMASSFPISIIIYKNLLGGSHLSVKFFFMLIMSIISWRMLEYFNVLGLFESGFHHVMYLLGVANIITALVLISQFLVKTTEKRLSTIIMLSIIMDFGMQFTIIGLGGIASTPGSMQLTGNMFILQTSITLLAKSCLIASSKNLKKLFHNDDIIENMGGVKFSQPVTLAGFITGTMGASILSVFTLDGLYSVLELNGYQFPGVLLFWLFTIIIFFNIGWSTIIITWVFGGKELPIAIRQEPRQDLTNENLTIAFLVACCLLIALFLVFSPNLGFLSVFLPEISG